MRFALNDAARFHADARGRRKNDNGTPAYPLSANYAARNYESRMTRVGRSTARTVAVGKIGPALGLITVFSFAALSCGSRLNHRRNRAGRGSRNFPD